MNRGYGGRSASLSLSQGGVSLAVKRKACGALAALPSSALGSAERMESVRDFLFFLSSLLHILPIHCGPTLFFYNCFLSAAAAAAALVFLACAISPRALRPVRTLMAAMAAQ